jgi:broad specificity phosphatase PhoE
MRTTLLFVRHASTQWTAPPSRYQGRTDLPLSPRGHAEAEQLADRLQRIKFDAIYSSPLRRARETAVALGFGRLLPLETDDRIIELSYGDWEGKRHAAVEEEAEALTAWASGTSSPPGGESRVSLMRRVSAFLDHIGGHGTVAVVTHKEVIRASAIALGLLHPADYLPDVACELSGV